MVENSTGAESQDSQERKLDKELNAEQDELKKLIAAPQLISNGEREKRIAQLLESSFDKAARIQELRIARMQSLLDFNRRNRRALIQEAYNRAIAAPATSPEPDSAFVAQRP